MNEELAPVNPSGEGKGPEITLEEVLPYFEQSFLLKSPFLWLVGGLVAQGKTKGDIDVLVRLPQDIPQAIKVPLEFRLYRMLPEELRERLSIMYDLFAGPFTDSIEIADLKVKAREEPRKVKMEFDILEADFSRALSEEEVERLDLERFRSGGIDEDLADPVKRFRFLLADLRYLGDAGYPRLKQGKAWGEWKLEDILKYFAKIVDTLRGKVYLPLLDHKGNGEKKNGSSWWNCYWQATKFMKTKPPSSEDIPEWNKRRAELLGNKKKDLVFELGESEITPDLLIDMREALDTESFPDTFREEAEDFLWAEALKAGFRAVGTEGKRANSEARRSQKEDKVVLFRRTFPMKSALSALEGYRKGEVFSVESAVNHLRKLYERGVR